jgi:hypothetical protein
MPAPFMRRDRHHARIAYNPSQNLRAAMLPKINSTPMRHFAGASPFLLESFP